MATAEVPDFIKEGSYYTVPGGYGGGKVIKIEKIDHDWLYIVEKITQSGKPPAERYFWININSDNLPG